MRTYVPVIVIFQSFVKKKSTSHPRYSCGSSWLLPPFLTCAENWSNAINETVLRSSDATVTGSVLEFASQGEDGGEGGNRNVEKKLPHISQAVQVQVA